jgi:RHS repeat-associated protein
MERTNHHSHVTERLMFLPTGEVFMDEQNSTLYHSDFLFSGKELDAETGNYYYGARYYAPRIGIWLSPAPMQLKYPHVSSYAFCHGNPVNRIDLLGLYDTEAEAAKAASSYQEATIRTYEAGNGLSP